MGEFLYSSQGLNILILTIKNFVVLNANIDK